MTFFVSTHHVLKFPSNTLLSTIFDIKMIGLLSTPCIVLVDLIKLTREPDIIFVTLRTVHMMLALSISHSSKPILPPPVAAHPGVERKSV